MNQLQMPMVGVLKPKKHVEESIIGKCRNYRDAVRLCIRLSQYSEDQIAERLGISKGAFSTILNRGGSEKRRRYLDPDRFGFIQDLCGNTAISQFFELEAAGKLHHQRQDQSFSVEEELARQRQMLEQMMINLEQRA